MKFSNEELQAVLKSVPMEKVYETLRQLDAIGRSIAEARSTLRQAETGFEAAREEFKMRLKSMQANCPHYSTTYQGDPSGNNDSHTVCNTCGKEV